ncbi:hypothetical protein [Bradyrhizobium cenepequi]|jgi:hypothetical protein
MIVAAGGGERDIAVESAVLSGAAIANKQLEIAKPAIGYDLTLHFAGSFLSDGAVTALPGA